jgi:3-deoxy-manno-octulosonate cytidylyltransferase (CMP-KDO synthetase)
MKIIALIPARYDSSRFPGKLMKVLGGERLIFLTYNSVVKTNLFNQVCVITDSVIIYDFLKTKRANVLMSLTNNHECGTDRIAEMVNMFDSDIFFNIQADEPFINKRSLIKLINTFKDDKLNSIDLASLMTPISEIRFINNPNVVKVITDINNYALYFSRHALPFKQNKIKTIQHYKHIGVYAFRKKALIEFSSYSQTPIESIEKIEAIRFLEIGKKIKMIITKNESIGIDTPEDFNEAELFLNKMTLKN